MSLRASVCVISSKHAGLCVCVCMPACMSVCTFIPTDVTVQ